LEPVDQSQALEPGKARERRVVAYVQLVDRDQTLEVAQIGQLRFLDHQQTGHGRIAGERGQVFGIFDREVALPHQLVRAIERAGVRVGVGV
jgi:hypothetical protein